MDIIEKLNILNLSEKERKKMETKGLIPLSLCTKQEIADIVGYLRIYDIKLNFASRFVICLPKEEVVSKIKIMNDLGEIDLYKEDPNRLCRDANDLKMKIEYAKENGVAYKENGKYKKFLFNEELWEKEFSKETVTPTVEPVVTSTPIEVDVAPVVDNDIHNINIETNIPIVDEQKIDNTNMNNDFKELEDKVISFQDMKAELEKELASLDALKEANNNDISFDDNLISFDDWNVEEEMGMRRAA